MPAKAVTHARSGLHAAAGVNPHLRGDDVGSVGGRPTANSVGEPALIATAPAILSAIRHATGARLTRTPVLPHRLWEALQRQKEDRA